MKDKTEQTFKSRFPIVLVNMELGMLRIVYRKGTTSFKLFNHETKGEIDKELVESGSGEWTPEHEVEMAVNSGFKRVHDSDSDSWALWNAEKKEDSK